MPSIEICQAARAVEAAPEQTILAAALAVGIAYPFGCQSGNCGARKSRLLSGTVCQRPCNPLVLPADERARGLILACRAVPQGPCAVAWLELDEAVVPRVGAT